MNNIVRLVVAGMALVLAFQAPAYAEDWPTRSVTMIVPLGAGSASDVIARLVTDQVGRQLGQTFVIENRPGAGGTIGANMVAKAQPDGYTLLAYGALAGADALYSKLPYDTLQDLTPVVPFGQQPLAVVVAPGKYKTLADLIAAAKARPGALNYSSAGVGSSSHFGAERMAVSAGIKVQHIPFKGAGDSLTEIMAGRVDFSVQPFTTTLNLVRDGKLVALAVSATKRAAAMPNVPTFVEAGLSADAAYPFYSAVFAPAKTPQVILDRMYAETEKALSVPSVHDRLGKISVEPMPMTRAEFDKFFQEDVAANLALVKAAKIPRQ